MRQGLALGRRRAQALVKCSFCDSTDVETHFKGQRMIFIEGI